MSEILPAYRWASFGFSMSARLRSVREMRGLSQVRLAELAGVSRTLVSNLERNQYNQSRAADPTLSTIYRLAYALRVPPAILLPAAGEEVGEVCWESYDLPSLREIQNLATRIQWPARPEDTQPFGHGYMPEVAYPAEEVRPAETAEALSLIHI